MGIDMNEMPAHMREKVERKLSGQPKANKTTPKQRSKARGRKATPKLDKMNKWEKQYQNNLEIKKQSGQIIHFGFEEFKLRLADRTFYTPDFVVLNDEHEIELHEVKGFWRDDARVKIKVAAEQFPWIQFVAITKGKGGKWEYERF